MTALGSKVGSEILQAFLAGPGVTTWLGEHDKRALAGARPGRGLLSAPIVSCIVFL
jgi:hypothetical protein